MKQSSTSRSDILWKDTPCHFLSYHKRKLQDKLGQNGYDFPNTLITMQCAEPSWKLALPIKYYFSKKSQLMSGSQPALHTGWAKEVIRSLISLFGSTSLASHTTSSLSHQINFKVYFQDQATICPLKGSVRTEQEQKTLLIFVPTRFQLFIDLPETEIVFIQCKM